MTLVEWRKTQQGQDLRRALRDIERVASEIPESRAQGEWSKLIDRSMKTITRIAADVRSQGL